MNVSVPGIDGNADSGFDLRSVSSSTLLKDNKMKKRKTSSKKQKSLRKRRSSMLKKRAAISKSGYERSWSSGRTNIAPRQPA